MENSFSKRITLAVGFLLMVSCGQTDEANYTEVVVENSTNAADIYIKQNLLDPYNSRVVWRWDDALNGYSEFVTPPLEDVVIPTVDMILDFWVEPFNEVENGTAFIKEYFPPEFVFIGSPIYNADGSVILGLAEAGVRITLTELDFFDRTDPVFLKRQLHTIHHEFTHIIHQANKLPTGYNEINPDYSGVQWINVSQRDALQRGMVTPYATSGKNEDFAELVATYITTSQSDFEAAFITASDCSSLTDLAEIEACNLDNVGKGYLIEKVQMMKDYYQSKFGINIDEIRDIVAQKIIDETS